MFKQIVKTIVKGYLAATDAIQEARRGREHERESAREALPPSAEEATPVATPSVRSRSAGRSRHVRTPPSDGSGTTAGKTRPPRRSALAPLAREAAATPARRKGGPGRLPFATWLSKQRTQRPPEDPINQLAHYWFTDEERPRISQIEPMRERLTARQASSEMLEALDAAYKEYEAPR